MIQVKFSIRGNNFTKTKKIQFCKDHEKNLTVLYGIAQEIIQRKNSDLEQLMIIFTVHVISEIRKKSSQKIIHKRLIVELSKYENIKHILKEISHVSIDAQIDNFPKKTIEFSPKFNDFTPILEERQVLR